jgi:8-oxo-dGTP pyrophosphatase MutT (NUDIX family)
MMRWDFVLLVLYNREGQFLLQHRDDTATYPGYWGFFGGAIEEGESPEVAMQREAFEELRYSLIDLIPKLIIPYQEQELGRFGTKYYSSELCLKMDSLELHEGQGMGWFAIPEMATLKMKASNRSILEKLAAQR